MGCRKKRDRRNRMGKEEESGSKKRRDNIRGWEKIRTGESGQQAVPFSTPIYCTVCHIKTFGNVSRCPGLVLNERPRRNVSNKYSWHCSDCKPHLSIKRKIFFLQYPNYLYRTGSSCSTFGRESIQSRMLQKRLKFR